MNLTVRKDKNGKIQLIFNSSDAIEGWSHKLFLHVREYEKKTDDDFFLVEIDPGQIQQLIIFLEEYA